MAESLSEGKEKSKSLTEDFQKLKQMYQEVYDHFYEKIEPILTNVKLFGQKEHLVKIQEEFNQLKILEDIIASTLWIYYPAELGIILKNETLHEFFDQDSVRFL